MFFAKAAQKLAQLVEKKQELLMLLAFCISEEAILLGLHLTVGEVFFSIYNQ